jgi:hypothetical protein
MTKKREITKAELVRLWQPISTTRQTQATNSLGVQECKMWELARHSPFGVTLAVTSGSISAIQLDRGHLLTLARELLGRQNLSSF